MINIRRFRAGAVLLLCFLFIVFSSAPLLAADDVKTDPKKTAKKNDQQYIAAKDGTMYHKPFCLMVHKIKPADRVYFKTKDQAEDNGYFVCDMCQP